MTAKQIKEADADAAIERLRTEFNDDGYDAPRKAIKGLGVEITVPADTILIPTP